MTNTKQLLALAERCEREEPSWDLDCAIAEAIGWYTPHRDWRRPKGDTPKFTTSLDAAVTLVPEHRSYELAYSAAGDKALRRARLWDWRRSALALDPDNEWAATAKTLALALCAAALRARAAIAEKEEA